MNMSMVKELSLMLMAGAFTTQAPGMLATKQPQPQSLTEYVAAANDGTLTQDPLVTAVTALCPVMAEAAEGQSAYAAQLGAACAMLQTGGSPDASEMLALLN